MEDCSEKKEEMTLEKGKTLASPQKQQAQEPVSRYTMLLNTPEAEKCREEARKRDERLFNALKTMDLSNLPHLPD